MPQILIRDVESSVVKALKIRAQQNGRSFEAELRTILQQVAKPDFNNILEEIEKLKKKFADRKFPDSSELLRKDRSR